MADDEKPTKEEVKTAMQTFFGPHGDEGIKALKDEPAAPPEGQPAVTTPPATEVPPVVEGQPAATPAPAKAAAKPKKAKRAEPTEDDEERMKRVAEEAASRAVEKAAPAPPPPAPTVVPAAELELDDEEKEQLVVLKEMGQRDPRYKDLADRTMKFWKAEEDYIKKWQKDNPGQQFDAAQHEDFYKKHEPQFEQSEFRKTERDLMRKQITEDVKRDVTSETGVQIARDKFERRWKEEQPEINQVADSSVIQLVTELDPELVKVMEVDHEVTVSDETYAKIQEHDPVAGRVLKREGPFLQRLMIEIERLDRYQQFYQPDPNNGLHREICYAAIELEEKIASLPKEDRMYDGEIGDERMFMRQGEWNKKLSTIEASKVSPAEKAKQRKALDEQFWVLEAAQVKQAVAARIGRRVKEKIAEFREVANDLQKRNGTPAPTAAPTTTATQPAAPAKQPAEPAQTPRPKPPSSSGGPSDKTTTVPPTITPPQNTKEAVDAVMFR